MITAGVLLEPGFRRTSEPAEYPGCGANLKAIGTAMLMYANTHRGGYPDSLDDLLVVSDNGLTADNLICPSTPDEPARAATTQQTMQALGELGRPEQSALAAHRPPMHLSYIYAAKGLSSNSTQDMVLAYEPLSNHPNNSLMALYGDGHVDTVPREQAAKMIAELQAGHNPPRADKIK